MMNPTKRAEMICGMAESLCERVGNYEKAAEGLNYPPVAGYGDLDRSDGREAIRRTITAMRDELLRLSKQI